MTQDSELAFYQHLCGSDPDKLAALEAYVSLLAARDDEDGSPTESLDAQIVAARGELRFQLGL
jgi:hypothetical protein